MASQGSNIRFTYVNGSALPANPDQNTVYFIPEVGLYVGSELIARGEEVDLSGITARLDALEESEVSVTTTGTGSDLIDVTFDDSTNTITITKGTSPYLTATALQPYSTTAQMNTAIADAINAIPPVDIPEYTVVEAQTPTAGSSATYQLTKDGTAVGASIEIPEAAAQVVYSIIESAQTTTGYAKTYSLTADGTEVGAKINIPKDLVVASGSVETVTTADDPYPGAQVGDKYIDLTLNDATEDHIYIPVTDLVDVYTAGTGISISAANVISIDSDVIPTKTEVSTMISDAAIKWQVVS